jgi:F-type H+-transporting ATPase subunit gamma
MAELIHMRQRIRTVETIKKITHAMRLVSMSAHAKLSKQYTAINTYHAGITDILHQIQAITATAAGPHTEAPQPRHTVLIAVGSQKGLCGSFNSMLFYELERYLHAQSRPVQIIAIGKKMVDFVQQQYKTLNVITFPHLTAAHASAIAQNISERLAHQAAFTNVTILSTVPKNFFVQTPRFTRLLPLESEQKETPAAIHDYIWEADPAKLLAQLTRQYCTSTIHKALIESLLAEQAARFVSMDSSTRNAEKILETTKLKYNKLRQAKITKELLELADTF